MSRDDVVLLVSRAIAVIEFIYGLVDVSYLPERFVSLHHYSVAESLSPGSTYFQNLDRVEIALLFGRIAGLLFAACVFWNCGPWVSRILLPYRTEERTASETR